MNKALKKSAALVFAFSAFFLCFAEQKSSSINPELQHNFVILESAHVHDLNPHTTSYASDSQIFTGIYEGLFSYNPVTLEPQPALAIDYKTSRDKKRITFTLRQDAYFSNGEKITAENVRNSWITLLETENAPYASLLDIIKNAKEFREGKCKQDAVGIYVTSDYTISVHLNSPANYLPKVLCHSAFSVVHSVPTVFSGPYTIDDLEDGCIILKKNPYYWDSENTHLEKITIIQSADRDENAHFYNSGLADWICGDVNTEKVIDKESFQFATEFATSYLFFKTTAKKPGKQQSVWDYPEFRNAVLEAMPWSVMRGSMFVPAPTLVFPLSGYPEVEGFTYTDKIEAKNLMLEARQKYGIPAEEKIPLLIEVSEYALLTGVEQAITEALAELDVEVKFIKLPSSQYFAHVPKSDSDVFSYTWIGDFADPLAFLTLFQGDSTLNDSGWKSDEFDSLLQQAASATEAERLTYLAKAEEVLLDSGIVIPVYHPVSFNLIDLKEVGGWAVNAFDIHPFKYLYKKQPQFNFDNVVKK